MASRPTSVNQIALCQKKKNIVDYLESLLLMMIVLFSHSLTLMCVCDNGEMIGLKPQEEMTPDKLEFCASR